MSWPRVFGARLRGLFGRQPAENELDDEVRFHLEMQIDDNMKAGMPLDEARQAALQHFGSIEPMKEQYRSRGTFTFIETVAQDVRYALRTLHRSPAFAVTSAGTLALAIAANVAMFSVLNAVILRPLPYRSPDQLVMVWTADPARDASQTRTAYGNVEQWRSQSRSFAGLAVFDPLVATLSGSSAAERVRVARVSASLFPLLGVQPAIGRAFTTREADEQQRLALISHRFWQTRFAGSAGAIGSSIRIDGHASLIIGILPADFRFNEEADVWEPHTLFPDWEARRLARGQGPWFVIGRLHEGVTLDQAQQDMTTLARRLGDDGQAGNRTAGVRVEPMKDSLVGSQPRLALWMLAGVVLCVLLIAAANVASLSLARGVGRTPEMALRAALGATPRRILRQLLAEGITLAAVSGIAGSVLAVGAIRFIKAFGPGDLARLNEASIDVRVLGWAAVITVLTGVFVGLAPAIMMWRQSLRSASGDGGRRVVGGVVTRRIRRALVVAEFAIAIMLLVATGLLVRSWWHVEHASPGFVPDRALVMGLSTTAFTTPEMRSAFYARLLEEVDAIPGVARAGVTSELLIGNSPEQTVTVEGDTTSERVPIRRDEVSSGFFRAAGTPILRGRDFSKEDRPGVAPSVIINDTMARRVWRGREAVGTRFKFGPPDAGGPWFTVVGVAADMRRQGLEQEPIPQVFESIAQNPPRLSLLFVRTPTGDPLTLVSTLKAAIGRVDGQVPVYGVSTVNAQLDARARPRRFQTALVVAFSIMGLLIATIGIYGLIQYSVVTRSQEIGIRLAIGAQAGDIFRMMIGEGLKLTLIGLAVGLVGAWWAAGFGQSLLVNVTATDPVTFIAVSLLLMLVATIACYFPARRAMKISPTIALRAT